MQSRPQSAPVKGSPDYSRHIRESLMKEQAELKRLRELNAQKGREEPIQRRSQMRTMYGDPIYDMYGSRQYYEDGIFIPPASRLRRQNAYTPTKTANNLYKHTRLG